MRARVFVSGTGFSLLRFGWVTVRVTAVVTHLVLYTYKHNQLKMSVVFPVPYAKSNLRRMRRLRSTFKLKRGLERLLTPPPLGISTFIYSFGSRTEDSLFGYSSQALAQTFTHLLPKQKIDVDSYAGYKKNKI